MGSRGLALVGHAERGPAREAREQGAHGRAGSGVPAMNVWAQLLSLAGVRPEFCR
jgi:hypothetical protein